MFASQIVDFGSTIGSKAQNKSEGKSFGNPFKGMNFGKAPKFLEVIKRHKFLIIAAVIFIAFVTLLVLWLPTATNSSLPLISGASQTNFSPDKQVSLNRKFGIPIRQASGDTTGSNLEFTLTTADKSKRILIQGKPATSRDTKTFLIINLEIQNSTGDQLTVKPVDLIRLIDSQGKSFAPDVHNNEVIVEPIAIKKSRVGFVVDENQKNFKFTFGEVNGNKETIDLTI